MLFNYIWKCIFIFYFFFYSGVGNGSWGVYCYLYCEVVLGGGVLCEGYSLVFGG